MNGQKCGSCEQRNPEIVYRQTETELRESDSEVHGIPCEAVGSLQDELGRGLPRDGTLACTVEKDARRSDEAQAGHEKENASDGADRPADRNRCRRHDVLKSHAQKNAAKENEWRWKPDLGAPFDGGGLSHAISLRKRITEVCCR